MIKSTIILYLLYLLQAPMGWKVAAYIALAWELVKLILRVRSFCRGFIVRYKIRKVMRDTK